MKTVTDLSDLHTRVVVDQPEIDRLRWFQVNRYFEGGLLDELPRELPDDPTMGQSTYFGVYQGEEIRATARLIKAATGLPMLEHHALYPADQQRVTEMAGCVAEVSRLAVDRTTEHYRAVALLAREFLRHGLRHQDATILIASVEKPLVRILNRLLGVPLDIIGPEIDKYGQYNGECVPILIDTVNCLQTFRSKNSRRWEFFVEDLVIDLTDTRLDAQPG